MEEYSSFESDGTVVGYNQIPHEIDSLMEFYDKRNSEIDPKELDKHLEQGQRYANFTRDRKGGRERLEIGIYRPDLEQGNFSRELFIQKMVPGGAEIWNEGILEPFKKKMEDEETEEQNITEVSPSHFEYMKSLVPPAND